MHICYVLHPSVPSLFPIARTRAPPTAHFTPSFLFLFPFFFSFYTLGLFYFLALSDGVTANVGAVHRSPLYTRALSPKRAFSRAWSAKWRRTWSRSSSAWRAGMRWMRAHIFSRASSLFGGGVVLVLGTDDFEKGRGEFGGIHTVALVHRRRICTIRIA